MPLTENDDDYRVNAYYSRLNKFLQDYDLDSGNIGTADFENISKLWNDLSDWSTAQKNCLKCSLSKIT